MKPILITREIDYAIRVIRVLYHNERQTAAEMVEKEGIPAPFAYKILKKLSNAGLIQIFRGPNGGYQMRKPCESLTLLDIVTALDDEILLTECMRSGYQCSSGQGEHCTVHHEFCRIQATLRRELTATPLSELLSIETQNH